MKKIFLIASIFVVLLIFWNCNDKSVNNDSETSASYKQGKCGESFLKGNASGTDSVFSYSFDSKLVIDFSVNANCCPDSGRFSVTHLFASDTLTIVVADTAIKGCHCICPYMIEAEFGDLSDNSYLVICEDSGGYQLHKVRVYK